MRELAVEAHANQTRRAVPVPYAAHVLSVGRIVDDALTETGELVDEEEHQEDIYLAAVGHALYEDTKVEPEQIRRQFGERVDSYIEGMTSRPDDTNRAEYLARMQGAVEPMKLIKLADLVDNVTSCAYRIPDLSARWIRGTFMPIAGERIANIGKAKFETFPETSKLMIEWLRFAYNRMIANLEIYADLDHRDPMEVADAAAEKGMPKASDLDPKMAEWVLRRMKEQEWREGLLIRGTYLFRREP
jgi:hypothetical protein